jgi:hypothetical protein
MLDRTIGHQQSVLVIKVTSALRRTFKSVLDQVYICRMRALQNQLGCWFRLGRIPVNLSCFLGPKYPVGTSVHSDETNAAEALRIR